MEVALVALATLVGATLQSATGFGFALLLGPAVFAVYEPVDAVVLLLILGALLSFLVLFAERRRREHRASDLRPILAASVPGMLAGLFVLSALTQDPLQVAVGLGVLFAVALQARGNPMPEVRPNSHPTALRAGTGLITGALTTTSSTNGPPLVLLFQSLGYRPAEQRDSLAAAFLFLNVVGGVLIAPFVINGEGVSALAIAVLAICTVVGQQLGRLVFQRIDPRSFRVAGFWLVTFAGIASIVAGIAGFVA